MTRQLKLSAASILLLTACTADVHTGAPSEAAFEVYLEVGPGPATEVELEVGTEADGWSAVRTYRLAETDYLETLQESFEEFGDGVTPVQIRLRSVEGARPVAVTAISREGEVASYRPQAVQYSDWLVFDLPGARDYELCCFGSTCTTLASHQICPFSTWTCTKKDGNEYSGCSCTSHCGDEPGSRSGPQRFTL